MIIKGTYFPHRNVHKETRQSPDRRTNNGIDSVWVDGGNKSGVMDVRRLEVQTVTGIAFSSININRKYQSKKKNTRCKTKEVCR
jgi:hypothetical protein